MIYSDFMIIKSIAALADKQPSFIVNLIIFGETYVINHWLYLRLYMHKAYLFTNDEKIYQKWYWTELEKG